MEVRPCTGITEVFGVRFLIAIVVMETEVGTAALLAGFVALPVFFVTSTWTAGDDARGCFPLPREICECRARIVIVVGHVDEMIRRVNRDLEKVTKAAVGAKRVKAGG